MKSKYFLHTYDADRSFHAALACLVRSGLIQQAALSPLVKNLRLQMPATCCWLRAHRKEIMATNISIPGVCVCMRGICDAERDNGSLRMEGGVSLTAPSAAAQA